MLSHAAFTGVVCETADAGVDEAGLAELRECQIPVEIGSL
jgi:hypothetical protein